MIKAVIFDIDGTAIPTGRWAHPSPKVIAAVKSAREAGIVITAATGRNYKFCAYILDELQITVPAIVAAGTQIIDPLTGSELWSVHLDEASVRFALEVLRPFACKILVDEDTPEEALLVDQIVVGKYRLLDVQDIPFDQVEAVIAKLRTQPSLSVVKVNSVNAGFVNLHITDAQATKEHAIVVWLEMQKLEKAAVAGVGDGFNDLELFKSVGHKVAMGNAVPELKAAADEVIGAVDADGLAEYLLRLIK